MIDTSKTNFIKVSLENPRNCEHTGAIDMSRPRIVILGGENTVTYNLAYSYILSIAKTLWLNGIQEGLDLYSVYYKIPERKNEIDRLDLFMDVRGAQNVIPYLNKDVYNDYTLYSDHLIPHYVNDIFNFAFKPQFTDKHGHAASPKKATQNLRNTLIYTHCHGAYALRMCERMIPESHIATYYSLDQLTDLQKNLMAINFAPFAPLDDQNFSSLSFCSASDYHVCQFNNFDAHMKSTPDKFKPGYYDHRFGNMMVATRIKIDPMNEHSDVGLSGSDDVNERLTTNGLILFAAERNALLCATRAMLNGDPMPDTPQLLTTDLADFNQLKRTGDKIRHELGIHAY